jgi:hypothetical protein
MRLSEAASAARAGIAAKSAGRHKVKIQKMEAKALFIANSLPEKVV